MNTLQKTLKESFYGFLSLAAELVRKGLPGSKAEAVLEVGFPWLTVVQNGALLRAIPTMFGPTDVTFVVHIKVDGVFDSTRITFQSSRLTPGMLADSCIKLFPRDKST